MSARLSGPGDGTGLITGDSRAHGAGRIHDVLLAAKDNYAADREGAGRQITAIPDVAAGRAP